MIRTISHCRVRTVAVLVMLLGFASCAKERYAIDPRMPERHSEEYKSLKAPFGDARTAPAEILAEGRRLYEGKGACYQCHGLSGKGDGPAAHMHRPAPRNFTDCGFQKAREDGELFWIIKHGSPGTGMVGVVPGLVSEEDGWKLVAYVRSFCRVS